MIKQYGILAFPAKHSLSPVMHNTAFKELNINAQYGVFEIPESDFDEFIKYLKSKPIYGLSVSLPYKEKIISFLHELDENAKKIGAVNTVLNKNGVLYGYNTDFIGSNMAMIEVCGNLNGKKAVVMGAGGASRAVIYGLLKEGAKLSIYNRTAEKAEELAKEFATMFDSNIKSGSLDDMVEDTGDIFIQTSSIWTLSPNISESELLKIFPKKFLSRFEYIMDIIYKPMITPLLKIAKELGVKAISGEKMLLYQAVEQFKLWTEKEAPLETMKKALDKKLISF